MTRRPRIGRAVIAGIACMALAAAVPAHAAPLPAAVPGVAAPWLSLGVLSGSTGFGSRLADYQWDVSPRAAWGAQVLAGAGRFGAGARVWRAASEQQVGGAATPRAAVGVTSLELIGRARLASVFGADLAVTGSAGWARLAWDPDRVTFATGGAPVVAELDPVNTWIAGGGVALRRPIAGPWCAGLEIEGRVFPVETAHRSADTIVTGRETFGDWSARLELARLWDRR